MTRRERTIAAVVAVVAATHLLAAAAYGEPCAATPGTDCPAPADGSGFWHVVVPWTLSTSGGTHLSLPPAYILAEPTYKKLDDAFKSSENDATRFKAENAALKADLEKWQPGWYTLGAAILGGIALGYYVHDKI